jgi:hypothetical protein
MRSSWEEGSIFVGLHGGANNASHGDLDIGNFVLSAGGAQFFGDLGAAGYNLPDYFGGLRWTYYRKRAEGQNTLTMGDVSFQKPDQLPTAVGGFERVESSPSVGLAILDTKAAYRGIADVIDSRRGLLFTDDRSTVIMQDEVHLAEATTIRWGAHTYGTITVSEDGRSAIIQRGNAYLYCEIISDDPTLRFTGGVAASYDPNYVETPGWWDYNGNKLMIITESEVTDFCCAVAMKVLDNPDEAPAPGTVYSWTDMADWVTE